MNRIFQHRTYAVILGLLACTLAVGTWRGLALQRKSQKAQQRLETKWRDIRAVRERLASTGINGKLSALVEAAEAGHRAAIQRFACSHPSEAAGEIPATRTDAYFELNGFFGKVRRRALASGVGIAPDECFGFGRYAQSGPETEDIPAVHVQCLMAERLLSLLIAARPAGIAAVQRTAPRGCESKVTTAVVSGDGHDYIPCALASGVTLPTEVHCHGFRLCFTGQTAALRRFLNRVVELEPSVLILLVEAEPVLSMAPTSKSLDDEVPLVGARLMRFTVTLEHLQVPEDGHPSA